MGNLNLINYDSELTYSNEPNSVSESISYSDYAKSSRKNVLNKIIGSSIVISSLFIPTLNSELEFIPGSEILSCNNPFNGTQQNCQIEDYQMESNSLKFADVDKLFDKSEIDYDFLLKLESNPATTNVFFEEISQKFIAANVDLENLIKINRYGENSKSDNS